MTASPDVLAYTLPGKPVTWARKRLDTRGRRPRVFTTDAQKNAMKAHVLAAKVALAPLGRWPIGGAFAIDVVGYYASAVVGDADRLASLVMDSLEGLAYETDRQVRDIRSRIVADGSPERVEVTLTRLAADPVQARRATRMPVAGRKVSSAGSRQVDGGSVSKGPRRPGKGVS